MKHVDIIWCCCCCCYHQLVSNCVLLRSLLGLFCVVIGDGIIITQLNVSVPTDLASINVTKSIEKYPTIPRSLQASDTASVAEHSTDGSTEVWGTEKPQHLKGEAAWICGEYGHIITDMRVN